MSKILIIEDDKFLATLISNRLKEEGFETSIAEDGEKGLAQAKQQKPSLIILDLLLPGMDGFEVLEKLKKEKETQSIPVIILSNLGQKEEILKGLKLGAVDYLVKANLTPSEIINKIKLFLK
jgi:DNA-binding response OmpR family regulator